MNGIVLVGTVIGLFGIMNKIVLVVTVIGLLV